MRTVHSVAIPLACLAIGCGEANLPNAQLYFTSGAEASALSELDHFKVERINTKGKTTKIFSGSELPTTLDLGPSGTYRFRATGYDADDNALARGETLLQDIGVLAGADMPLFLARTDRTSLAGSKFDIAPGEYPQVGLFEGSALWLWANVSSDFITTDAYNFAYWEQVEPQQNVDFSRIDCGKSPPCELKTMLIVGGHIAVAMGDDWALWVNARSETADEFELPVGLASFADVAGGRVLPGGNQSAVLVGAAHRGEPSAQTLSFDATGNFLVMPLTTARAGAATVFEQDVGLVVVGGSESGPGVERLAPGGKAYVALNYPADPVVGAALVVEDPTHVLRVGGQHPDASAAETVRIDVTCDLDACVAEPLPAELAVPVLAAQSFYDTETGDSLIVGEDPSGLTIVYRYAAVDGSFTEIAMPTNQARIHASAIKLPNRQVAIVGGTTPGSLTSSRSVISVVSF